MTLPHNAQCPSVRGMRSLTTTNLARCRNPLLAKVRFGFISSSVGSQSKIPALLGTQRVLPLMLHISRGRQFGPRWHESDSAQHEDHLQHEQQEVHDRSPVSAGESDQCLSSAASLKSDTTMIGATSDLFLADCDQHHRSEFYALSMRLEQINHRREWE